MRRTARCGAALGVAAASLVVVGGTAAPAAAEECPTDARSQTEAVDTDGPTPLLAELDLATLRAEVPTASGVGVAVLDTGIVADTRLALVGATAFGATPTVETLHGTQVAGVIGATPSGSDDAAEGVAPGVRLLDVQVADVTVADEGGEELSPPTADSITRGLVWAAQNARAQGIRVVTVSVGVASDPGGAMRAPLQALADQGVLVVAAQGDAEPTDETTGLNNRPSTDPSATARYPAAYDLPNVLAVAASPGLGGSETGTNLPSYRTDVVAPAEAITVAPGGGACEVAGSAAWATAVVSGVAALMFAHEPTWTGQQVRTRIVRTAGGVTDATNPYTGAGTVQPVEALTRQLDVAPDGSIEESVSAPRPEVQAEAPEPPADPLEESRDDFLWWGLLAGAVVGLALVLRPAVQRARRR